MYSDADSPLSSDAWTICRPRFRRLCGNTALGSGQLPVSLCYGVRSLVFPYGYFTSTHKHCQYVQKTRKSEYFMGGHVL